MKKFMMFAAFIGCALSAMTFTSCGDDNDEPGGGDDSQDKVPAYYVVTITYPAEGETLGTQNGELMTQTLTYTNDKGQVVTETLPTDKSYTRTIKRLDFNKKDSLVIITSVKEGVELDSTATYNVGGATKMTVVSYNSKGTELFTSKLPSILPGYDNQVSTWTAANRKGKSILKLCPRETKCTFEVIDKELYRGVVNYNQITLKKK